MLVEAEHKKHKTDFLVWKWGTVRPTRISSYRPYFYIPESEMPPTGDEVLSIDTGYEALDGTALQKVTVRQPHMVKELRQSYDHYEADIPFPQRYLLDLPEMDEGEPHILYFDIEVGSSGRAIPDANMADKSIISIATFSTKLNKFVSFIYHHTVGERIKEDGKHDGIESSVHWFPTEQQMLVAFTKFIRDIHPEILTAWNIHNFDMRFIVNRMYLLNIKPERLSPMREVVCEMDKEVKVRGRVVFDLWAAYTKYKDRSEDDNRLEAAARRELDRGKMDSDIEKSQMHHEWIMDPRKVLTYNIEDVNLMMLLDRRLGMIDLFIEIHRATHIQMADTLNYGTAVEYFTKRNLGKVIGSRAKDKDDYEGAVAFDVDRGLHKWVMSFDVVGMYPASMENCNMGPNTLVLHPKRKKGLIDTGNGVYFKPHEDEIGVYALVCKNLRRLKEKYGEERAQYTYGTIEYKVADNKRTCFKKLLNSVYGATGAYGRLGNVTIAAAVTRVSRNAITRAKKRAQEMGYEVPGGHTDSVHVKSDKTELDSILAQGQRIEDALNDDYMLMAKEMGIKDREHYKWVMEFAQVSKAAFWSGKTRYGMWLVWVEGKEVDKLLVKGFDVVRSDAPRLGRELQKECIDMALRGKSENDVVIHVKTRIKEVMERKDFSALAIPKTIRRAFNTYGPRATGMKPWIKGCMYANKHYGMEHGKGTSAKLLYIQRVMPGVAPTEHICFYDPSEIEDKIGTEIFVDWEIMLEKTIIKVDMVFEPLGWMIERIWGQTSLDRWS